MRVVVIRFPGSNCDRDAYDAVVAAGGSAEMVWHASTSLPRSDLVILPGGFSYGDYLRSGSMAAMSPVMAEVRAFADRGGLVLGICNGFQILTEAGLLPGQLTRNLTLHFLCRAVPVRVETSATPFTADYRAGQLLRLPIAHYEGRYFADQDTIDRLEGEGRVLFRYCDSGGRASEAGNPNGSLGNIAGIVSARGNVLGMMPHPERAVDPLLGSDDGLPLFRGLFERVGA